MDSTNTPPPVKDQTTSQPLPREKQTESTSHLPHFGIVDDNKLIQINKSDECVAG